MNQASKNISKSNINETSKKEKTLKEVTQHLLEPMNKPYTMDDLASELGCSKKTLYKYFHSKSELIESVWDELFFFIQKAFSENDWNTETSDEKVVTILYYIHESIQNINNSMLGQKLNYVDFSWDKYFEIRSDIFEYHLEYALGIFEKQIIEGFNSVAELVQFLLATIEQYHFYTSSKNSANDKKFIDHLVWLVYNSILVKA